MQPKIIPPSGSKIILLGGTKVKHSWTHLAIYLGYFPATATVSAYQSVERGGLVENYTPQPGHLFLQDGTDLFTGQKSADPTVLAAVAKSGY
jgi:hypothetical protein